MDHQPDKKEAMHEALARRRKGHMDSAMQAHMPVAGAVNPAATQHMQDMDEAGTAVIEQNEAPAGAEPGSVVPHADMQMSPDVVKMLLGSDNATGLRGRMLANADSVQKKR